CVKLGDVWGRGWGEVAVAMKRALVHSRDRGAIVSAGAEVTFPTGKEDLGLGGGQTIFEPFVAYSQILARNGFVHVHAGLEFMRGRTEAPNESYFRAALGWSVTGNRGAGRTWSPMIELLSGRELETGARTNWDVVREMEVTLSKRGHISASGGVQVPMTERLDRHTKVVFYLLWDWFDGGFFSGW